MIFLTGWLLFVYFPFVHMVWGGGLLAEWGVLDFAGGIVVHNIAGIAALASVLYVGRSDGRGPRAAQHPARGARHRPAVVRLVRLQRRQRVPRRLGHGRRVPQHRPRRLVRGDRLARRRLDADERKPKFVGLLTGAVAGLATITPAAGYVSPAAAALIGIDRGRRVLLRRRAQEPAASWDDALDVWGVHGVGGFLGIVLLGVFATTAWNPVARRRGRPARGQRRASSCKQLAAVLVLVRSGRSSSRSACCGSSTG